MDGWVGGYLVVPTLHLHLNLHYLYSLFFRGWGVCSTCSSTCSSYSLVFSFGDHLQGGKSSYNLAKKNSRKGDKIS